MKLSVAIIAKNEEEMIGGCLASVKGADEIIVSENDSTDKTVEIARHYGAKVYSDYVWQDDFGSARNYTLEKCTGDWVLVLDCDNRLEAGGIEKIREAIKKTKAEVLNVTWFTGKHEHKLPWLFKNTPERKFIGKSHEYLNALGQDDSGVRIEYFASITHAKDPDRVTRILGKELEKNPNLVRERFYYAREFYYQKKWGRAINEFDLYLKVATWLPEINEAMYLKTLCLWNTNQGNYARKVCGELIIQNPDFKNALLLMADLHFEPWKSKWLYIAKNAKNTDVLFS